MWLQRGEVKEKEKETCGLSDAPAHQTDLDSLDEIRQGHFIMMHSSDSLKWSAFKNSEEKMFNHNKIKTNTEDDGLKKTHEKLSD